VARRSARAWSRSSLEEYTGWGMGVGSRVVEEWEAIRRGDRGWGDKVQVITT
jgi:hypothetical protein